MNKGEIIIYDDKPEIDIRFVDDTVWLSQRQMAQLFDRDTDTIGLHLKNIYQSEELDKKSTTEKSSVVQQEGARMVRDVLYYNLDVIISVGYRVISGYTLHKQRSIQKEQELRILKSGMHTNFVCGIKQARRNGGG